MLDQLGQTVCFCELWKPLAFDSFLLGTQEQVIVVWDLKMSAFYMLGMHAAKREPCCRSDKKQSQIMHSHESFRIKFVRGQA